MIEFGIQKIPITVEVFTYPEKNKEYETVTEIDLYIEIIFGYIQKRHTYKNNNWYYVYEFLGSNKK